MIKKKGFACVIAFALTVCMVMSMSPVVTFATSGEVQAEEQPQVSSETNGGVKYREPVYREAGNPASDIRRWEEKTCENYTRMSGGMDHLGTGWYVVDSDVDIDGELYVGGHANIILCNGAKLDVDDNIRVPENSSLTIYGNDYSGELKTGGKWKRAGIGGNNSGETNGPITINGGIIIAKGGMFASGIGGGDGGFGKNITINAGDVNACGALGTDEARNGGAGIGGGNDRTGSDIVINGGTVNAEGTRSASAIGGGDGGSGERITINGGNVTAQAMHGGASIGGGKGEKGDKITINGGRVTATHSCDSGTYSGGAGIGGGGDSTGSNITINGGYVTAGGDSGGAGIGGGDDGNGEQITINDGSVRAYGRSRTAGGFAAGAGIGGGRNRDGKDIKINGGIVRAHGELGSAGIGGGENAFGTGITISGGSVVAHGGRTGAGIGGGEDRSGQNITISGGKVEAHGGSRGGAGIGGGEGGSAENINIEEGIVTAAGNGGGAGIGGGEYFRGGGDATDINIKGGRVTAYGNAKSAGIGGGEKGKARNIRILGGKVDAYGGSDGGAGIGGGYKQNADGIYFENCEVKAVGNGRADAVGSAKSSGKSNNIKVQTGLYLNNVKVEDGGKDRAGELYNVHNVRIAKNAETTGETGEHKWTFKAEGPVITATCSNVDHEIFSPEKITLCEPENTAFNGKRKEAGVNGFIDGVETPDVIYYRGTKELKKAPSAVGTYVARVTLGEGESAATAELEFVINPAAKAIKTVKAGGKKLTVKWKKSSKAYRAQTTGYQIKYSTNSLFEESNTNTVYAKAGVTSKTIKKLKAGKKYYVKMRTYKTVGGQKYWSTWSKVKVKKTK